jgi:hypothetical protein
MGACGCGILAKDPVWMRGENIVGPTRTSTN